MNLEMLVGRPSGTALVDDYVTGGGTARSLFRWDWTDPESFRARAHQVALDFDPTARERLASMLGVGAGRTERLERWVGEGGFVVTTGQQPALFGGPLHTVYKALTAVRLANHLESLLGVPVLPIFWVASEDHDWEEAHHTWIVGVDNELHHIELPEPPPHDSEQPLHRMTIRMEEAVGELLRHLPNTDFSGALANVLRECWGDGRTNLPESFRRTLEALLGPFGLYFVDAHDPRLKEASRGVLLRELHGAPSHEAALADRARTLEERGYHVQVPVLEGAVNLFVERGEGRERLYRDGTGYRLRRSGTRLSPADLEAAAEGEGGTVSPNVLLRPVVEAAVLPTLAYVGGPGEIAYFAELEPLFEAHGVTMPVVVPRRTVTLVEAKVRKVLDKFGTEPAALAQPFHELAGEIARDELPEGVRQALGRLRGAVGEGTAELARAAVSVDPTLKGPISRARTVALDAIADAERKIIQAVKRENEVHLQQLEKARLHLFPDGHPQERVMNVFYYLARYGEAFLAELEKRLDPLPSQPAEG
jgi:bacillithiol biosynthesis cysteine-adding enzyme BshC